MNVADDRELLAGVVARPGGGSALRADAQATYVEPKPKGERIPAGAGYLEAEEVLGHKVRVVGTTNEAKIEATAKLIDDFRILQRNGPEECGFIPSEQVILKGTFRSSPGGPILAETEQRLPAGFCDYIGLTIRGRKARALYDEREGLVRPCRTSSRASTSSRFATASKNPDPIGRPPLLRASFGDLAPRLSGRRPCLLFLLISVSFFFLSE